MPSRAEKFGRTIKVTKIGRSSFNSLGQFRVILLLKFCLPIAIIIFVRDKYCAGFIHHIILFGWTKRKR